jgi:hypothetical protein
MKLENIKVEYYPPRDLYPELNAIKKDKEIYNL